MRHSKYCNGLVCDGKISCPVTKKQECCRKLNFKIYHDGSIEFRDAWCFGCNTQHVIR